MLSPEKIKKFLEERLENNTVAEITANYLSQFAGQPLTDRIRQGLEELLKVPVKIRKGIYRDSKDYLIILTKPIRTHFCVIDRKHAARSIGIRLIDVRDVSTLPLPNYEQFKLQNEYLFKKLPENNEKRQSLIDDNYKINKLVQSSIIIKHLKEEIREIVKSLPAIDKVDFLRELELPTNFADRS